MFMKNFFKHKNLFDFSNFSKDSRFYDNHNEMVIGLKSKTHSMLSDDGKESNTVKGVNIATEFNEFKATLFNKKLVRHKMKRIQSKKHKIGAQEINRISLSCFDDKIFVLDDGIHTLAYFHKDLKNRFSQIIINKKMFLQMIRLQDSHR